MVAGYLLGSGSLLGSLLSYLLSLFSQTAAPLESRMLTLGIKIAHCFFSSILWQSQRF